MDRYLLIYWGFLNLGMLSSSYVEMQKKKKKRSNPGEIVKEKYALQKFAKIVKNIYA